MSKCKKCGKEIKWIKTVQDKNMPCDIEPVIYWEKTKGKKRIVTQNGLVISCELEGEIQNATGIGYIPHWANCRI